MRPARRTRPRAWRRAAPGDRTPARGAAGRASTSPPREHRRRAASDRSPGAPARPPPWPCRRWIRRGRPRAAPECPCARGSTRRTCRESRRTRRWSSPVWGCTGLFPRAPRSVASPRRAPFGQLGADVLIHVAFHHMRRDADGILDGPRGRGAVADDDHALHPEEWRTAIFGIVEESEQLLGFGSAQHVGKRLLHHPHEHAAGGLVELEDHVTDEAVANYHVDAAMLALARQDVPPFDVADVPDAGRLLQ